MVLSRFYDEIGTPLLSDISINYTESSVDYITQNLFTNYFNGSEIVIAGKLKNQSAEFLHVQVTASNNDRNIILEMDVPLRRLQIETEKHVKAAAAAMAARAKTLGSGVMQGLGNPLGQITENFVERVWGFLSVKEGLRSRLRSQTSKEREGHAQQAANLSVTYHFLTPLTNMVVEKPRVLADGTMEPAPTITPGADEAVAPANDVPDDTDEEQPQKSNGKLNQIPPLSNIIGEVVSIDI